MTFDSADSGFDTSLSERFAASPDFTERVRANQLELSSALKPQYHFIVCGSGSSGSVVARRLAENSDSACFCWRQAAATTYPVSSKLINGR